VSAFGSGTNENTFLIDGTNFTCPCNGVSRAEPGVDFIQEVQVQSVGASAEFGSVQGHSFVFAAGQQFVPLGGPLGLGLLQLLASDCQFLPQLFELLEPHPDCYFQVFTNGQLITDDVAAQLRRVGNVSPLVSVEGTGMVSDERRGRMNVLSKTMAGLAACRKNRLITGVATSVCRTNIDDLVTELWDGLSLIAERNFEIGELPALTVRSVRFSRSSARVELPGSVVSAITAMVAG